MPHLHATALSIDTKAGTLDMFGSPKFPLPRDDAMVKLAATMAKAEGNFNSGVGFSEVMSGFIHAGPDVGDFHVANDLGRSRCESARFFLSVRSWDVTERTSNPNQPLVCAILTCRK